MRRCLVKVSKDQCSVTAAVVVTVMGYDQPARHARMKKFSSGGGGGGGWGGGGGGGWSRNKVYKAFLGFTQLSMTFQLLITRTKMLKNKDFLVFKLSDIVFVFIILITVKIKKFLAFKF